MKHQQHNKNTALQKTEPEHDILFEEFSILVKELSNDVSINAVRPELQKTKNDITNSQNRVSADIKESLSTNIKHIEKIYSTVHSQVSDLNKENEKTCNNIFQKSLQTLDNITNHVSAFKKSSEDNLIEFKAVENQLTKNFTEYGQHTSNEHNRLIDSLKDSSLQERLNQLQNVINNLNKESETHYSLNKNLDSIIKNLESINKEVSQNNKYLKDFIYTAKEDFSTVLNEIKKEKENLKEAIKSIKELPSSLLEKEFFKISQKIDEYINESHSNKLLMKAFIKKLQEENQKMVIQLNNNAEKKMFAIDDRIKALPTNETLATNLEHIHSKISNNIESNQSLTKDSISIEFHKLQIKKEIQGIKESQNILQFLLGMFFIIIVVTIYVFR
jgi:gas vesicle protein